MVGGYENALSWTRHHEQGESWTGWARDRRPASRPSQDPPVCGRPSDPLEHVVGLPGAADDHGHQDTDIVHGNDLADDVRNVA